MEYPENRPRYLLLPDIGNDGICELVDVAQIQAIEKDPAEDYETVDEDTGEVIEGHRDESCYITYGPKSHYNKDWRKSAKTIRVELSMAELLKLINSDAQYHIHGKSD